MHLLRKASFTSRHRSLEYPCGLVKEGKYPTMRRFVTRMPKAIFSKVILMG